MWVEDFGFSWGCNFGDPVVVDLPVHQSLARCDGSGVDEILDMAHRLLDVGRALDYCKWEVSFEDVWEMLSKRKGHPKPEKRAFWAFGTNEGVIHGF